MKSVSRWYGWKTLIPLVLMDVVTVSTWAAESNSSASSTWDPYDRNASNSSAFSFFQVAFLPVHTLAGPVVHWAHGNVRQGFVSLGLHMSMAYLTLLPMVFVAGYSDFPMEAVPVFSVIGALTANAIDIAYLSHDTVQVPLSQSRGARTWQPSSLALVPMLNAQQRGLALIGQF